MTKTWKICFQNTNVLTKWIKYPDVHTSKDELKATLVVQDSKKDLLNHQNTSLILISHIVVNIKKIHVLPSKGYQAFNVHKQAMVCLHGLNKILLVGNDL